MSEAEFDGENLTRVSKAFEEYRSGYGPARLPRGTKPGDLTIQITREDGLMTLADGAGNEADPELAADWHAMPRHLWAVRTEDVVHALENSEFGSRRETGVVKHTNLTGGAAAYAGGEAVFTGPSQIVVNGCSGRYPVRSADAMLAIAVAFKQSGYDVWSTGWDPEGRRAVPFEARVPARVS